MLGNLETVTVELGKGNVVVLRETTGADEILAIKILGKALDKDEEIAGGMQQLAAMMVISMKEINGTEMKPPHTYEDVLKVLAMFKTRQVTKIREAFLKLNGDEQDFLPEQTT